MTRPLDDVVVGVGCTSACPADELIALVQASLVDLSLTGRVVLVGTRENLTAHPAVHALSAHLHVPVIGYAPDRLEEKRADMASPSEVIYNRTGCHGVAEGAALAAAGPGGQLIQSKRKSAHATCALALRMDASL